MAKIFFRITEVILSSSEGCPIYFGGYLFQKQIIHLTVLQRVCGCLVDCFTVFLPNSAVQYSKVGFYAIFPAIATGGAFGELFSNQ